MSLAPPDPRLHDSDGRTWNRGGGVPWKFTRAQRAAMVRDYVEGVPIAEMVARYGCSRPWPGILAKQAGYPLRTKRERG